MPPEPVRGGVVRRSSATLFSAPFVSKEEEDDKEEDEEDDDDDDEEEEDAEEEEEAGGRDEGEGGEVSAKTRVTSETRPKCSPFSASSSGKSLR